MYAMVTNVTIAPGQSDGARRSVKEEVVPRVRQAPGFVKGYWAMRADSSHGVSMIVFQTKDQAEAAAGMARGNPMPTGVTLDSIEVREIVAEA